MQEGDAFISLYPSETLKISYGLDLEEAALVIGKQWFTWVPSESDHYRWVVAPARTFYTSLEVRHTASHGRGEPLQRCILRQSFIWLLNGNQSCERRRFCMPSACAANS